MFGGKEGVILNITKESSKFNRRHCCHTFWIFLAVEIISNLSVVFIEKNIHENAHFTIVISDINYLCFYIFINIYR